MRIQNGRIRLAPFSVRHLTQEYIGWLNDKSLMRYSEQKFCQHSIESSRDYMFSFVGTPNFFWAIEDSTNDKHVGNLNAYVDPRNQTADLGILVGGAPSTSQGIGTEAWMAACDFLFRYSGMRKITAGTLGVNKPMIRVFEKAGMQDDGIRARHVVWEGGEVDMLHFALFGNDWLVRHPQPLIKVIH
jgi:RimJ/RimL family protein N-acetyltransferase